MNKLGEALREEIIATQKRLEVLKQAEALVWGEEPQAALPEAKGGTIGERIIGAITEKGPMPAGALIKAISPVNPQSMHGTLQAMKKTGQVYLKGKAWHLKK